MTDDIRARLAEIRNRTHTAATSYGMRLVGMSAADVPALLAAIEAVLKHHERQERYEPAWSYGGAPVCGHNPDSDDWGADHEYTSDGVEVCLDKPLPDWCTACDEAWPCVEVRAITAALSGSRETPSTAGTSIEEATADD